MNIDQNMKNLIIAGVIIICTFVAGKIISMLLKIYFGKVFSKTKTKIDDRILEFVNKNVYIFSFVVLLKISFGLIDFYKLEKVKEYIEKGLDLFIIAFFAILIIKVTDIVLEEGMKNQDNKKKINYAIIMPLFKNMGRLIIWIFAACIMMIKLGYSPLSLFAGMGIAGIAVSFAAQSTIANFLSGIFLLVDGPFVIGDRIKIGESTGDVIEIGTKTTRIKTIDNHIVTIPNSKVTTAEIINISKPDNQVRVNFVIGVSYSCGVEKIKELLYGILRSNEMVLKTPEPMVLLIKIGQYTLDFDITFFIDDFKSKGIIMDLVNIEILREFEKAGITLPYPVYDIRMVK